MTFDHPFFRAAAWLACCAASAAQAGNHEPVPAGPAAADAAVPATKYQPVLPYRPAPAPRTSPDQNWKELNRTVAGYNSMSLTMGGMEDAAPQAGASAEAPQPPAAGSPPAAAAPPDHHHHHEASK
jgi:hypothetical protein